MAVLAVMAAGFHTMSIAAPALAEQDRQARTAERAVVPNPAAADGMPVSALLGGIVLAFAVGLSAGQVQRRRRAARRVATAKDRPAPAPTPSVPARPAPPPPEPVVPEPKPVSLAAPQPPAPPPPPAPVRSHGPRILRFRAAPAPPPPEPAAEEIAEAPADEVVEPPARQDIEPPHEGIKEPARESAEEPAPDAPSDEVIEAPAHEIIEQPVADAPSDEVIEEPSPTSRPTRSSKKRPTRSPKRRPTRSPKRRPTTSPKEPVREVERTAFEAPDAEIVDVPAVESGPAADEPAVPSGPLGAAAEQPQRDEAPPSPGTPATPLANAPEALRRRGSASEPVVPARRFARARPWPKEAETLWTCEIAWKAGYLKSAFRAMAGPPGASRRRSIGESPSLRWTLMTDPEPPTPEMIASVKALISALVAAGWERTGSGGAWYAQRFIWRGSGEPGAVAVPDEIQSAEQPPR